VRVPKSAVSDSAEQAARASEKIGFPVVLKGQGIAHKTEAGAVALNLCHAEEVEKAANSMPAHSFLVEEMEVDTVAELLVGVVRDPAHGFVLTLAAGGTLTELLNDGVSLLLPASHVEVDAALSQLKFSKLLDGYRGQPAADRSAIRDAIFAIQAYVLENSDRLDEIEINPLLCTPKAAIAADALMRREED